MQPLHDSVLLATRIETKTHGKTPVQLDSLCLNIALKIQMLQQVMQKQADMTTCCKSQDRIAAGCLAACVRCLVNVAGQAAETGDTPVRGNGAGEHSRAQLYRRLMAWQSRVLCR